ncbi:MAG: lipid-A-disaccharide synthase [Candidatus Acididesulfobacter diazotrophicus]|uniref:Lipid-A-disaccharide synthase n=1 Tax=Candidatus Acididesulfobacter diazotrophicus TaxID=2597226 RepID=A0A519BMF0_9DELT|nr:MAG: lipid-A-disaccharide synthase [Candidatus Acididesulfobacter diazotrophicus]
MGKILIVSGELSGDWLASGLIKEFKKVKPDADFYAMGGENLKSEGAEIIADLNELAVMGFIEVVLKISVIKKILKRILAWIKLNKPDLIILVDFPTFNFKIAKYAHQLNIPVVYYVPPKIWASRYKRIYFIKKYIKFVIVIFPFEINIYEEKNIKVYYCGNPLQFRLNKLQKTVKINDIDNKNLKKKRYPVISFLPGSRKSELKYHSSRIVESAKLILFNYPDALFVFPFRKGIDISVLEKELDKSKLPKESYNISNYFEESLLQSDIIIVASGTASLEAAMFKKPVIIVYYLNYFTYLIAKIIVKVKDIGLINIIAGKRIVPELIESQFTPENVYNEAIKYLKNDEYHRTVISEIEKTISTLDSTKNPFKETAEIINKNIFAKQ